MYRTEPEPSSSFVVTAHRAIVTVLHRLTGAIVWQVAMDAIHAGFTIPLRVVLAENVVLVLSSGPLSGGFFANQTTQLVTAFDVASGQVCWRVDVGKSLLGASGTMLLNQGQLLVATPATLTAISVQHGVVQWTKAMPDGDHENKIPIALAVLGQSQQVDRE